MSQPNIRSHLKVLRERGMVRSRPRWREPWSIRWPTNAVIEALDLMRQVLGIIWRQARSWLKRCDLLGDEQMQTIPCLADPHGGGPDFCL